MTEKKSAKEIFISDLIKAQKSIEGVVKNTRNSHYNSNYIELSDLLAKIKPKLNENNLFLFYSTETDNNGDYIVATILHINGESLSCRVPIKIKAEYSTKISHELNEKKIQLGLEKNDPQKYGSAITYAKRYSISALLAIEEKGADDDGNDAASINNDEKNNHNQNYEAFKAKIVACKTTQDLEQIRKEWPKQTFYFSKNEKDELIKKAREVENLINTNHANH